MWLEQEEWRPSTPLAGTRSQRCRLPGPLGQDKVRLYLLCALTAEPQTPPLPGACTPPSLQPGPRTLALLLHSRPWLRPFWELAARPGLAWELGPSGPGADLCRPPCPALCVTLGMAALGPKDRVRPLAHTSGSLPRVSVPHCTVHARRGWAAPPVLLVGTWRLSQAPCCPPTKDVCWGGCLQARPQIVSVPGTRDLAHSWPCLPSPGGSTYLLSCDFGWTLGCTGLIPLRAPVPTEGQAGKRESDPGGGLRSSRRPRAEPRLSPQQSLCPARTGSPHLEPP